MFYILQWFMQDTHMRPLTVDGYTCSNTLKSHTWLYLLLAPIRRCWSSQVSPLALHGDRCTPIDALMANSHALGMHHRWWEYIHMMRIHICVLYIYMFVKIYLFKQWKYLVHTSSQTQALTLWTHLAGIIRFIGASNYFLPLLQCVCGGVIGPWRHIFGLCWSAIKCQRYALLYLLLKVTQTWYLQFCSFLASFKYPNISFIPSWFLLCEWYERLPNMMGGVFIAAIYPPLCPFIGTHCLMDPKPHFRHIFSLF